MRFIEVLFHANAVLLAIVGVIAYNTPGAMLVAAALLCMMIMTEAGLLLFKDDTDPVAGVELKVQKVQRKLVKARAKRNKKRRERFICSKCQSTIPVLMR